MQKWVEERKKMVEKDFWFGVTYCHGAKAGEQDREQMKNLFID